MVTPAGARGQRCRDRGHVVVDELLGILALGGDDVTCCGVAEHRQRDLVELDEPGAPLRQVSDLLLVHEREVGEEGSRRLVRTGERPEPELHRGRRGQRDLHVSVGDAAYEVDLVTGDRFGASDGTGDVRRGEREPIARLVGEREPSLPDLETLDLLDEAVPVRETTELPVGHDAEASLLLHLDHVTDGDVLCLAQCRRVDHSIGFASPRFAKCRGTQERSDVVGSVHGCRHHSSGWTRRSTSSMSAI